MALPAHKLKSNLDRAHQHFQTERGRSGKTLLDSLGIEILEITSEKVTGKMPVDERTHRVWGVLHGGASLAFAETLCSIGSFVHADSDSQDTMGLELNANHIKSVKSGWVYGEAKPIHLGRRTQVWQIEIKGENQELVCTARCTMIVIERVLERK